MVGDKRAKKPPLPVSAVDTMKKGKLPPFPAVQIVCVWALLTACAVAGNSIYNIAHQNDNDPAPSKPAIPSPWVTTIQLTGAEAMEVSTMNGGQLWCTAPQAAAAVLAMLLPAGRPRIRRAMAFVALAATAANHYMYARMLGLLFVPAPGNVTLTMETVAVFVSGLVDVGFLALLLFLGKKRKATQRSRPGDKQHLLMRSIQS